MLTLKKLFKYIHERKISSDSYKEEQYDISNNFDIKCVKYKLNHMTIGFSISYEFYNDDYTYTKVKYKTRNKTKYNLQVEYMIYYVDNDDNNISDNNGGEWNMQISVNSFYGDGFLRRFKGLFSMKFTKSSFAISFDDIKYMKLMRYFQD